jgi:hypothetical protein
MQDEIDDMPTEYEFDYSKAKPNRFAERYRATQRAVVLDDDVADSFPDAESVNDALRSLIRVARKSITDTHPIK